jgi:hypothetical protein
MLVAACRRLEKEVGRYDYCVVVVPVVPVAPVVPVPPMVVPLVEPVAGGVVVCGAGDGMVTEPSVAGVAVVLAASSELSQAARAAAAESVTATKSARFMKVSLKVLRLSTS